ncbi:MAG: hypothetical protein K2X32_01070 [Phycisphaerales bacterium]|nr:hypothetical protein [Phycisphaerales bacterium]
MKLYATRTPVGVDLTASMVTCVRAERASGARASGAVGRVVSYAMAQRTSQDLAEAAALVAGLIRRQDMGTRRVVISAPEERLLTSIMELPARSSGAPIEMLAASELARTHRVEASSLQVAAWELPLQTRAGEGVRWLVAALPKQDGSDLVNAMQGEGLIVDAIDLRSLAVARACGADMDDADALTPILQLERCGHSVAVVFGGELVYERRLESPQLRGAIALIERAGITDRQLALDVLRGARADGAALEEGLHDLASQVELAISRHATELLQQVRLSIAYVAQMIPQSALRRVLLTGELAGVRPIAGAVSEGLALETRVVGARMAEGADRAVRPELACAMGLALSDSGAALVGEPGAAAGAKEAA